MKKYISLILICVILFSLGSCNKDNTGTPEVPDYNLEVGHEKFEDIISVLRVKVNYMMTAIMWLSVC